MGRLVTIPYRRIWMSNAIHLYRLSHRLHNKNFKRLSKFIDKFNFLIFNSMIPGGTKIGAESKLAYGGIGVVVHEKAIIGKRVIIGQNTTIGRKISPVGVPRIGDNVYIGAGARILGDVNIGSNVIVGANSVVVKDVPDNCIVAGNPASVIRQVDVDIYDMLENIY